MNKTLRAWAIFMFSIAFVNQSYSQDIDHWETIIQTGDNCKYFVPTAEIGTTWRNKDFDDSSWTTAASGIGYGDGDDNTVIATGTASVYLRFTININDASKIDSLILDADYDDGFVAYLNGTEISRANVNDPISWNMELANVHEAAMHGGGYPERYGLNNSLVTGKNVLAIEVHNQKASSSDFSSNIFLHLGLTVAGNVYGPTPDWFDDVPAEKTSEELLTFENYNLPLIVINTNGQDIPQEAPRIVADMGLIYNGVGQLNRDSDNWNEYSGKISIKRRGESSSGFKKRSYSIELQNADGTNNNVSLLGLPEENDFALYGPYSDQTMIKNVLSYEIFRRTGRWAPRTRYVEIILDGDYRGVYVLTETIKRDKNRVDIDKLTSMDIEGEALTGGYILRRDKKHDIVENVDYWTSPVQQPYHERLWYEWFDPKVEDLTTEQIDYIKNWMKEYDEVMSNDALFKDPDEGYRKYIRTKSFIDMMFVNEISKGIDNYMFSNYFYKENDSDGGQLVAGAPWDYNLAYGNLNYGNGWNARETFGWAYPQGSRIYWYERLMEDEAYQEQVRCRWSKFRSSIYSNQSLENVIDSCVNVLGAAVERNFTKYPTLGTYIWPAIEPFPETHEGEVDKLKTWLLGRLEWMDSEWLVSDESQCSNDSEDGLSLYNNSINENEPAGSLIGEFVTDGENTGYTYTLVGGSGSEDNSEFIIKGNQIKNRVVFDYEKINSYSIRVRSSDDSGSAEESKFTIVVNDISEAPTAININNNTIFENEPIGTSVGDLLTSDQDINDSHTNSLVSGFGDDDNASFSIAEGVLTSQEKFDYETKKKYTIRIKSEDTTGKGIEGVFHIFIIDGDVNDQNQTPTDIILSANTILENESELTLIGNFSVIDVDQTDTHSFSLVTGDGSDHNSKFRISNAKLLSNEVFDFEEQETYNIRVEVKDNENATLEKSFEIKILDDTNESEIIVINSIDEIEEIPFFLFPNPTSGSIQIAEIESSEFKYEVQLLDMTGSRISDYKGHINDINNKLKVESEVLRAGVYILKVNNGFLVKSLRFIKR